MIINPHEQQKMDRKHIFAVNGSPEFLDIVRQLLQEEHYNVTTTNFVPTTFDQIESLAPSLLIIDLAVGEQAGWDLLEHLAISASVRDIPVIIVSTTVHYLDAIRDNPDRFGGQRLLQKPFDLDDLVGAVNDLIGPA